MKKRRYNVITVVIQHTASHQWHAWYVGEIMWREYLLLVNMNISGGLSRELNMEQAGGKVRSA